MKIEEITNEISTLLRERRFSAAVNTCDNALGAKLSKSDRVQILIYKARALVSHNGKWAGPSIECLKDALELCKHGSDDHMRILCAFTAAAAGLGSLSLCKQNYDAFEALYLPGQSSVRDLQWAHCMSNLADCFHQVEALDQADELYLMSIAAYQRVTHLSVERWILHIKVSLIDIFHNTDQYHPAGCLIEEVASKLSDDDWGATIRLRRGIQASHLGDQTAALLWLESGLGHKSCDDKTRAALLLAKAEVVLAMGAVEEAHDWGMEALKMAALAKSSHLSERITRFLNSVARGGIT